jgi:Trk K+ transport system NAD-binding subunit
MAHKRGRIWRAVRNSPGAQIAIYFLAFALLIGLYTYIFHAFYPVLEGKPLSWTEALLFVVESMATVGYGWLLPFSNDITRLLAIQIMISGVIMIFIVVPLLLAPFLTTLLAPTPPRKTPHKLSGHTVVFGYDELTRSVIESLTITDHDIVILEQDRASALEIATRYRKRAYVIWGDYTDPATWEAAHLAGAGFIVICKDERLTANIILGIRRMAKGRIISIVDKLSFDRYLRYAGADYVLSPKHSTGRMLARHAALNPGSDAVPDIPGLDRISLALPHGGEHELRLINIPVVAGCKADGRTLGELRFFDRYGILVFCLWKSGTFVPCPHDDIIVDDTTSLFLFGRAEALREALRLEFDADGRTGARAVIAGFGDVGSAAYRELLSAGVSCTIVDSKPLGMENQVVGNAEDEEVLNKAGITGAHYCIVGLNDDDVNIFTTLMARNLNPGIRILARANEPASVDKLYRAGADYVALLPTIGGQTIGRIVLADIVTVLLDLPDGRMVIMKSVGKQHQRTAGWFGKKTGVRIIGIESVSRSIVAPCEDEVIEPEDQLIAAGDTEQLKKFIHLL